MLRALGLCGKCSDQGWGCGLAWGAHQSRRPKADLLARHVWEASIVECCQLQVCKSQEAELLARRPGNRASDLKESGQGCGTLAARKDFDLGEKTG